MIRGCEVPRIYTPEARELTEDTTDGFAAIKFAERGLGLRLFPWQKWLLLHGLEIDPVDPRLYRFRTVIVEMARQNGKTLVMVILALWHLYGKKSRLVIGTAQDLPKAEESWRAAVDMAQSDEELEALISKIKLAHPKVLEVVHPPDGDRKRQKSEYMIASTRPGAGRGFSADLVLLDELRQHKTWENWASVTKTLMARPRAQTWAFSNAGDNTSVVLRYQRALAQRALGWPDGDTDAEVLGELDPEMEAILAGKDLGTGWFEWSSPPGAKRTDMEAVAQANGSLNYTDIVEDCITERALLHALATDPPHVYETECMCRWVAMCDLGPFPEGSWAATSDPDARPASDSVSVVCVEVSVSRQQTVVARAGFNAAGDAIVGVWVDRAGTDWVLPWLESNKDAYKAVVVRSGAGSPVLSLLQEFEEAELPVANWEGKEVGAAHGQMFDRLRDGQIRHLPHPGLDLAATSAAVKPLQAGGWIVDTYKSPSDTCALWAAIGAVWGLSNLPDDNISIYAKEDVLVLERTT